MNSKTNKEIKYKNLYFIQILLLGIILENVFNNEIYVLTWGIFVDLFKPIPAKYPLMISLILLIVLPILIIFNRKHGTNLIANYIFYFLILTIIYAVKNKNDLISKY
jgi:hypothetical protein